MNKHDQSTIRLLSVATVAVGLMLWAAASPMVALVRADPPDSNPYSDPTQCLYRAWDLAAQAGHKLPWFPGDAKDWRQGALSYGYEVVDTIDPSVVHSVAVWGPGVGGASWAGHVGWVVAVDGNQFLVQDRNWIPATDWEHWVTWVPGICFIKLGSTPAPPPTPPPTPQPPSPTPAPPTATPTPTPLPPTPTPEPPELLQRRITISPASRAPRTIVVAPRALALSSARGRVLVGVDGRELNSALELLGPLRPITTPIPSALPGLDALLRWGTIPGPLPLFRAPNLWPAPN
jgi:surface antigen